jgi:hypothetical protein
MEATMLADNTYTSYCSHWRKYKRMMRETEGTEEYKYWEGQLTGVEIRILNGGREIPQEKEKAPLVTPNNKKTSTLPPSSSEEVAKTMQAYERAKNMADSPMRTDMLKRIEAKLKEQGVEVESALSETKTA